MKRSLLILATAALGACSLNTTEIPDTPSDPATETFASALGINIATMTRTANGDYYKEISIGSGGTLTGTPTVMFTYAGFLKDASVFAPQTSVTAPGISLGQLVFGMQEGMQGMKVGGERLIVIPSALGYGNASLPGIPPNSTIIFDVKLDQLP